MDLQLQSTGATASGKYMTTLQESWPKDFYVETFLVALLEHEGEDAFCMVGLTMKESAPDSDE